MIDASRSNLELERGAPRGPMWWAAGALAIGIGVALVETRLREMQSALLIYFLASFWIALPRRAPALVIAIVLGVAPMLVHAVTGVPANWSAFATLGAVALGAAAGAAGGGAFGDLDAPAPNGGDSGALRHAGLGPRALLSLALTAFAALGVSPVWSSLRWGGLLAGIVRVPPVEVTLVAVRWAQAVTLVGWVLFTPVVLRSWRRLRRDRVDTGLTATEAAAHVIVVAVISAVHTGLLVAAATVVAPFTDIFFVPPPFIALWQGAAAAYGPLDLLTYIAILGLAYLTDRTRQAAEARRRASALEATAVTARLAALKARLDPHFLYNALNAAVTLARRGNGDETSRVLEELTAILRYVLDDTRDRVALSEELAFVGRYLEIMRLRFGARLTFTVDAEPNVADVPVPPLVLQPLVENAVEHGVANATGPVDVRVRARREGAGLVVTVEDDGVGPDAERANGSGIGLGATRERLTMLFGGDASVTLSPRAPRGAVTELRLPTAAMA